MSSETIWKTKENKEENKPVYNYNTIREEIAGGTPNPLDFGGRDPYSDKEIAKDLARLEKIKNDPEYKKQEGLSDADIQEYATAMEIGEMDWFGEDSESRSAELFPDDKGAQTHVFLTSEFDDHINHVDAVAVINNSYSDFKPVPFALDLTYNTDDDGLDKKFSWEHKKINKPGFCTVKYFEDILTYDPDLSLPKGRINIMPRFIVGFSPDLSEQITEQRMKSSGGFDSLSREEPSAKAKFCVLNELKTESGQMLKWLEDNHDTPELAQMYENVTALDKFFESALEFARKNDPLKFESYSDKDQVTQKILSRNIIGNKA